MANLLTPLLAHARHQTPPGPRGHLLGALHQVLDGRLYELLEHMWRAYGDLTSVRVGAKLMVSVVHPRHIHEVLAARRERYTKESHRARVLLGDGLPASNGESWARQRRLLQPRFVPRELGRFDHRIEGALERVIERWGRAADDEGVLDLDQEMTDLTLDLSLRALSNDYLSDEHAALRCAIVDAVDFVAASGQLFRLSLRVPTARNRRFVSSLATIHDFVDRAIRAHRDQSVPRDRKDLLSTIMDARAEEGSWMSDELVRDEAISLLLGAYDSTARALTWTWALLDAHRDVRARLQAEVDQLGGRTPLTPDRGSLPWTLAVIHETLRLYPPFWVFPRHVAEDDELGGYAIPKGSTVMISPFLTHRHPDLWPMPERFDPERFLADDAPRRARASAIYFGFGPRTCVGNHLALLETTAVIGCLAQRFELTGDGRPPVPEFATTLRPRGGLKMRIRRREGVG
ncbi:MAG: cytochrome P450 [Myxococcales bacterium]|nr:cytochrome P450 [Myxococcales bacterium]